MNITIKFAAIALLGTGAIALAPAAQADGFRIGYHHGGYRSGYSISVGVGNGWYGGGYGGPVYVRRGCYYDYYGYYRCPRYAPVYYGPVLRVGYGGWYGGGWYRGGWYGRGGYHGGWHDGHRWGGPQPMR